jgi:hypothetical protein
MNAITPIWETRTPVNRGRAFEIIRNAHFSINIPQSIDPGTKKLIELIIRRWTASGYWLDFNLLGKGRSNGYPLNLPGVKAEEGWAKVLESLLKLCIACHRYTDLKKLYFWPNHLWLAVVNDMVQQDINSALKGGCFKKAVIKGNRYFLSFLKKGKMPSREEWGDAGICSYQLFEVAIEMKNLRYRPISFTKALEDFIDSYEKDITAYDQDNRGKAALVKSGILQVQIGRHPQTTGWKPLPLPKLPTDFWSAYPESILGI